MTSSPRTLVLASKNAHKKREFEDLLAERPETWHVRVASELEPQPVWEETGTTFLDNARIKAQAVRRSLGSSQAAVIADDSGLEVFALGGAPGIYSSRYAGGDATDQDNNEKLLRELADSEDRRARFVCVIVYVDESGRETHFEGSCPGRIERAPRGQNGFGYDPLFVPDEGPGEKSMAELSAGEKNALSHRGRAVSQWLASLGAP